MSQVLSLFLNKNNDVLAIISRGSRFHLRAIRNLNKFEIGRVRVTGGINLMPFPRVTLLHKRYPASSIDMSINLGKILNVMIM